MADDSRLQRLETKLDEVITTLQRMEERQIKTTGLVEEMEQGEQTQVQGSFGSTEPPPR